MSTSTKSRNGYVNPALATPTDLEVLLPMVEQYWRFEAIEGFDATRMRNGRRVSDPMMRISPQNGS